MKCAFASDGLQAIKMNSRLVPNKLMLDLQNHSVLGTLDISPREAQYLSTPQTKGES